MKSGGWYLLAVLFAVSGIIFAIQGGVSYRDGIIKKFQAEAVANGAGFYHPQTKEFTWVKRKPVTLEQKRIIQTDDGRMWVQSPDGTREPYNHGESE